MSRKFLGPLGSGATDLVTRGEAGGFPSTYVEAVRNGGTPFNNAGAFATVPLNQLLTGNAALYNTTTFEYTTPSSGLYLCLGDLRWNDGGGAAGASVGIGIHTSNVDGTWFQWGSIPNVLRRQINYRRLVQLTAGDKIKMYTYYQDTAMDINVASMRIVRLA